MENSLLKITTFRISGTTGSKKPYFEKEKINQQTD